MTALWQLTATEWCRRLARGEVSARESVEAQIARIEAVNPAINALVVRCFDQARREADAADARRARGDALGPLHGLPISIKECLAVAGTAATGGLLPRKDMIDTVDDPHVARLRAAGAIVLGKTNVPQLMAFVETENPLYGLTRNPWHAERACGGSTGGEGALVAAGGSPLGLGTDIGGSIRVPAAFCGIFGLKPGNGRSNDACGLGFSAGQRAIISQAGVLARCTADIELGTRVVLGEFDAHRSSAPLSPLADPRQIELGALRVAMIENDGVFPVHAAGRRALREAADHLRTQGVFVEAWTPPPLIEAQELFYHLLSSDRGAEIRRQLEGSPVDRRIARLKFFASRGRVFNLAVAALLRIFGQINAAEMLACFGHGDTDHYWRNVIRRQQFEQRFHAQLQAAGFDAVLMPAFGTPPYRHGQASDLGVAGTYSSLWNVLGWPAGIVPVTRIRADEALGRATTRDRATHAAQLCERDASGLPVAVQLAAPPWQESRVLALMQALETRVSNSSEVPRTPVSPFGTTP
ncbi:MAG: amidase [Xanthomonadales bacterium]|nr:amidase [Xanthomonadales bacterium]MBK7147075.1 amidase [Xanthomonadales bacterium]